MLRCLFCIFRVNMVQKLQIRGYQDKGVSSIFFLYLQKNKRKKHICCWYSLAHWWGGSNECQQFIFLCRNKKSINTFWAEKLPFPVLYLIMLCHVYMFQVSGCFFFLLHNVCVSAKLKTKYQLNLELLVMFPWLPYNTKYLDKQAWVKCRPK